jgi:hypothetical protein
MPRTAFLSLEAELEILADLLEEWAARDRNSAVKQGTSVEMRSYWQGRCDGWEEAAKYVRKTVDASRPTPADNHPSDK